MTTDSHSTDNPLFEDRLHTIEQKLDQLAVAQRRIGEHLMAAAIIIMFALAYVIYQLS